MPHFDPYLLPAGSAANNEAEWRVELSDGNATKNISGRFWTSQATSDLAALRFVANIAAT